MDSPEEQWKICLEAACQSMGLQDIRYAYQVIALPQKFVTKKFLHHYKQHWAISRAIQPWDVPRKDIVEPRHYKRNSQNFQWKPGQKHLKEFTELASKLEYRESQKNQKEMNMCIVEKSSRSCDSAPSIKEGLRYQSCTHTLQPTQKPLGSHLPRV